MKDLIRTWESWPAGIAKLAISELPMKSRIMMMTDKMPFGERIAAFAVLMSMAVVVCAVIGAFVITNQRSDRARFIDTASQGISIGYLCQSKGWSVDQCRRDFEGYMTK
jgi:hypothetical protein